MAQQRIGKYQILQRIAAGTQGTVDRATDSETGRLVAIKVLHPSLLDDQAFVDRFHREARLTAKVDHPNVVRIFDEGRDGDDHYIVMEFLPENLFRLISRGQLSVNRAASLAAGIADGLGAIHELGIVHRDVKPQNVLITDVGVPKITDFGIARDESLSTLTAAGVMMGTPHYMSPEQAEGRKADARSDVYALGCIVYQMLTGEVPFKADTPLAVLRKHVEQPARPISALKDDVPPELAAVVEQAMAKEPDSRFANGDEMAAALRLAVPGITPATSDTIPPKAELAVPEPPPADPTRPPLPIARPEGRAEFLAKENEAADERAEARKRDQPSAVRSLISALFVLGIIAGIVAWVVLVWEPFGPEAPTVQVHHWTTGHLTREGLLPEMAEKFNDANYLLPDGTKIEVNVYDAPSELQAEYLIPRVLFGTKLDLNDITNGYVVENIPDPTILTPSSAHWLVTANYEVGREVVDIDGASSIVRPVIGIVTYEEMARCLGWPVREIGFEDIIALREDPNGWASYPCAKAEWGQKPLLAFTDPTTSSTGRSLHLSLYSIAAGVAPEDLTIEDVNNEEVIQYVKDFQKLIDHYQIGTTVLNTKIVQGKSFGHFFIMPEDNLIHLYEGTESAFVNGIKTTAPPIEDPMVMIYPKEGSMPRNNCACIVSADWVSPQQRDGAAVWVDFIRQDEQQRAFMAAGFRPGTDISLADPASKITAEFGLNPSPPRVVLNPSLTKPEVAAAIDAAWVDVKRPGIVTFIVDTSGSMSGGKIQQAKDGMKAALDAMAPNNQVGFLSFADKVQPGVDVAPLADNKFLIAEAVDELKADGQTALYDAISAGVQMTDAVDGDPDAIRAVVVLTDGKANKGVTRLDDIIRMSSRNERRIDNFAGMVSDVFGREEGGRMIPKAEIIGSSLLLDAEHEIQIFFIGIGDDADLDVGRMLAGATSAEFQGTAEDDLANLLAEFSKYF